MRPWGMVQYIMGVGRGLQELGRYLDDCERSDERVESIDIAEVTGVEEGRLTADLELTLSADQTDGGVALCDPQIGDDGTVRFALETTTALTAARGYDVDVQPAAATLDSDGTLTMTLAATVPASAAEPPEAETEQKSERQNSGRQASEQQESGRTDRTGVAHDATVPDTSNETQAHDAAPNVAPDAASDGASGRDVPPFKDPELLAEIYDSCETFAEMAEALEMDVTGETVRRYMIQHDIHEPRSYQTSDQTESVDGGQPVVVSDGIGLPDDVTVDTLIETVERSNTLYEVTQDIDVDRQDALEMLKELNLIDLVMGQLATKPERDIGREDVIERLREASAID